MKRLGTITTVAVLVLSGALAGCRGADDNTGGEGGATNVPGVTSEPCPQATDKSKGCIYLGIISDLTEGPFKANAVPITEAQKAFWGRVNQNGGIGGKYEVDVITYVKDNKYKADVHNQVYQEIKGKILALAQSLGSPTTAAIIDDLRKEKIVAAPASWTSAWNFEDVIVESGANYCVESMNAVDYAREKYNPKSVMAVHYPGDYGADAAAGAKYAAEKLGMTFADVQTGTGAEVQAAAIQAILTQKPDLVIVTTGPAETAAIVGGAAARGFRGRFIGTSPTWNPGLITSAAKDALIGLYEQSVPWKVWGTDSPGHNAMRQAVGNVPAPNEGYTSGWVWSYPLKAALEKAVADNKLTRDGLLEAAKSLTSVDYEGMLPSGAGNYAGGSDQGQVRLTAINKPDPNAPTKVSEARDFFTGPTAQSFSLTKPCFQTL